MFICRLFSRTVAHTRAQFINRNYMILDIKYSEIFPRYNSTGRTKQTGLSDVHMRTLRYASRSAADWTRVEYANREEKGDFQSRTLWQLTNIIIPIFARAPSECAINEKRKIRSLPLQLAVESSGIARRVSFQFAELGRVWTRARSLSQISQ